MGSGKYKAIPLQATVFQEFEVPRITRQSAQEGGKVVSHTHRQHLQSKKYYLYLLLIEAELTPVP